MTEIQSGTKSSIQKPGDILEGFLFCFGFFCEMQPKNREGTALKQQEILVKSE